MEKMEQTIEFVLVTPNGLERDEEQQLITRVGKLPSILRKEDLNIHDLIAVSSGNSPFQLGVITNMSSKKAGIQEIEYVMTKPDQENPLMVFVKRLALQTGRAKILRRKG